MKKTGLFASYLRPLKGNEADGTEPELRGKNGSIISYDDKTLSVFVTGAYKLHKLANLPGAVLFSEGDGEGTVHLPIRLLDTAADVIGAKRKRRLSDEQRASLSERARMNFLVVKMAA